MVQGSRREANGAPTLADESVGVCGRLLQEKYQEAIDIYLEALDYSPENPELLTTVGLLYLRLGENFKAFDYLGPPPPNPFDGLPPLTPYATLWTVHNGVPDLTPHPRSGATAMATHPH